MSDSDGEVSKMNGYTSEESESHLGEDYSDVNEDADETDAAMEDVLSASVDEDEYQDDQSDDMSASEGNDKADSNDSSEESDDEKARRAELRKMMNEEQRTVVATISQAAKADAEKGAAVKKQRKTFDSLLNVRIRLQKALISSNSLGAVEDKEDYDAMSEPYKAAEEAAMKLWNTLGGIRDELSKASSVTNTGKKRKRDIDTSTSSSTIWERMQDSEVAAIDFRQTTLEKWSAKVKGTTAMPVSRKLNPTAGQQSITSVLQEQVASSDHLVKRTKMPRSCAPIQAKLKLTEDPDIYDDADFYQMLLRELVDQRMVDSSSAPTIGGGLQWMAIKEAKPRKGSDLKLSKGRKLKYTVHEKLQNFMAPEERGTWEQDAIDRFFGTLLGQKMTLGEDAAGSDEDSDLPLEEEGLKLFRS